MNWTQIETWVALLAAVGLLIERIVAWRRASGDREKAKADAVAAAVQAATALYQELCKAQQERIAQLQAHLTANEVRISALEKEKAELVTRYTAEIEALERQFHDVSEALAGKQAQIAALQSRVTEQDGKIAELEAENAKLKEELARISAGSGGAHRGATARKQGA